ncbi:hypothetical protein GCM10027360_66590 [Amycolatopsis echigonensis]
MRGRRRIPDLRGVSGTAAGSPRVPKARNTMAPRGTRWNPAVSAPGRAVGDQQGGLVAIPLDTATSSPRPSWKGC